MKKIAILLAAVMLFGIVASGCTTQQTATSELAVHVGSEPDIIDPALNSAVDGATLIVHAFEGLMTLDKDG
ncbi:MAG TPA: peptide ABC transporter substrate-binding protein, partial [Ruminiclostridium sp.]|nr:peptide ABC transporter substrate-binding protein [Ruminiclostridium sp.]